MTASAPVPAVVPAVLPENALFEFGCALQVARTTKRFPTRKVANRMGLSKANYLEVEEGLLCPTGEQFARLSTLLPAVKHWGPTLATARNAAAAPASLRAAKPGPQGGQAAQADEAKHRASVMHTPLVSHAALVTPLGDKLGPVLAAAQPSPPPPAKGAPLVFAPGATEPFGAALRRIRTKDGASKATLASALRVSNGCLDHWENDRTVPQLFQVRELVALYPELLQARAPRAYGTRTAQPSPIPSPPPLPPMLTDSPQPPPAPSRAPSPPHPSVPVAVPAPVPLEPPPMPAVAAAASPAVLPTLVAWLGALSGVKKHADYALFERLLAAADASHLSPAQLRALLGSL